MGLPKYLNPDSPSKRGRKREDKALKQINSGALWFSKADIKMEDFLIDVKDTEAKSFTLNAQKCEQLFDQAIKIGKRPLILLYMGNFVYTISLQHFLEVRK